MRLALLCAFAWVLALGIGAFGHGTAETSGRATVVATTGQAGDLVRAVAGDRVRVVQLLASGAEPHDHELRPSDVEALDSGRLVVRSGGEVDEWLERPGALSLLDHVRRRGDDPHWWQDPRNAIAAVRAIRDALTRADPAGRGTYATAAHLAERRLDALDHAIERCWQAVPRDRRLLVTTHDAYAYYAARYGLRVAGAVIPSQAGLGQPSAGEVERLIRTIRRERIRAIFVERALDSSLERAIAEQAGASVAEGLWGDTLGPPGSDGETYMAALASDTRTLVDGLAGRHVACELPG